MRPCERVVLHGGVDDPLEGRERPEIDLEESGARRLAGKADVGNGDLIAVGGKEEVSNVSVYWAGRSEQQS